MTRTNQRRIADEVRKEKHMRVRKRIMTSAAVILVTALTGASAYGLNRYFTVSDWHVALDRPSTLPLEQMIDEQLSQMENLDFWRSRPALLRQKLLATIPDLDEVHIRRQLPHALEIHAEPRVPVALWQKEAGKIFLVDAEGHAYRQLSAHEDADLPVLRMSPEHLAAAGRSLQQLQQTMPRFFAQVSEVFATGHDWKFNFARGQQWLISAEEMAGTPFHSLAALLDKPRWQAGNWRIDMRIENRWFLRPAGQEGVI